MRAASVKPVRCAIYTRVSTEHGLDQEFNSLDAQYEAASAYIKSQAHAGSVWSESRLRAFCMRSTPQVVALPQRKYAGAVNSFRAKVQK
jgi:hypothetical protein